MFEHRLHKPPLGGSVVEQIEAVFVWIFGLDLEVDFLSDFVKTSA